MTSVLLNLAPAQRRLMNVLYETGPACSGAVARQAKRLASADHEDVVGLATADLVEGRTACRGELIDIPARGNALYVGGHTLRLTNLGISWCNENPLNRLLRTLDEAPRGRFTLDKALAVVNDRNVIGAAVEHDGYAALHFAGDLRETKFGPRDGEYEFAHPKDYALIATPKIRTVLGPKG
jgi:hypothetical protein